MYPPPGSVRSARTTRARLCVVGWLGAWPHRGSRGVAHVTAHPAVMEAGKVQPIPSFGEVHDPCLGLLELKAKLGKDRREHLERSFGFLPGSAHDQQESRRGESHPPALAEPGVNLSAHGAPIVQRSGRTPNRQWANRPGCRLATSARNLRARRGRRRSRLYFRMARVEAGLRHHRDHLLRAWNLFQPVSPPCRDQTWRDHREPQLIGRSRRSPPAQTVPSKGTSARAVPAMAMSSSRWFASSVFVEGTRILAPRPVSTTPSAVTCTQ